MPTPERGTRHPTPVPWVRGRARDVHVDAGAQQPGSRIDLSPRMLDVPQPVFLLHRSRESGGITLNSGLAGDDLPPPDGRILLCPDRTSQKSDVKIWPARPDDMTVNLDACFEKTDPNVIMGITVIRIHHVSSCQHQPRCNQVSGTK